DDTNEALFSKYLGLFKRYAAWVNSRVVQGEAETFTPVVPRQRRPFTGWPSEHTDTARSIHLWQTSQILLFLMHYSSLLHQHIARAALQATRFSGFPPNRLARPTPADWDSLAKKYDPVPTLADDSEYRVYRRI